MRFEKNDPPRVFRVGENLIAISDCGKIHLEDNDQVTFVTASGREHDFTAKSWGFYATPSVNGRLIDQGFKTALVRNSSGKYYVMVIDKDKIHDFEDYLASEKNEIVEWLNER